MKEIFSRFFRISILTSIIFMIFGLLLFFNPEGIITLVSSMIGIFLILMGVCGMIMFFKDKVYYQNELIMGIFAILSGILLVTNTNIIATIIPIIIGISMIGLGAKKLEISFTFKDHQVTGWLYMLVMAILTLVFGIILIMNPIKGAFIATQAIGIIIVLYSILDIVDSIIFKNNLKKINKIIEQ